MKNIHAGAQDFPPMNSMTFIIPIFRMPSWKAKHWHISWRFLGILDPSPISYPLRERSHIPPWESRNIIDSKLAFLGDMFVSRRVIPSSLTQKLAPSRNQGFFDGSLDRWPVISRRGIAAVGCGNVFKKTGWIPFLRSSLNDAFETSESLISSYKEAITRCWFQKIWQVVET